MNSLLSRWISQHRPVIGCLAFAGLVAVSLQLQAGDWPQWRGENRDGKVTGFTAPSTWPKELTRKWKITVGEGVATPALVGDKLYVFTWLNGKEMIRCLNAETGKELWKDEYDAAKATGPASGFPGARSSPTVADGKVVTLGVQGTLSCINAATGEKIWRKMNALGHPSFFTSSSPLVVDDLCIAQFGSENSGGIAAYDMKTGDEKWKWTQEGAAYASPVMLTIDGSKIIVAETSQSVVGLSTDGKTLWKVPFPKGMGRSYNASTPVVDGQSVVFSGSNRGTRIVKVEKSGDKFEAKEGWSNKDNSVIYNTPIVHKGMVFGLTANNALFCINADGKTAWTNSIKGKGGYGSIVNAGAVLLSLTPSGQLVVYEPSDKEFKEVAAYKVADTETYAYPVVSGNRVYVKDKDSLMLYTIE